MTVVINGTTGVSGVAGSASTPALIGSDADSGFYINSANEPNASVNGTAVWSAASTFGMKNRLINGGMTIDQRNAGASVSNQASRAYALDRWASLGSSGSKFTIQQTPSATETGYATRVGAGFTNYMAITSSAATSVASGDYYTMEQRVEGFNVADLAWGTANAKPITISFWVYSSLTGTFGGSVVNSAQNRSYPFTYTISAASTWEQKTITVAGDTSGTWVTTNGIGIDLIFGLGVGSTFSNTAGAWVGSLAFSATGATNVVSTNGATWYITGVQLEKGSTATSFDFRSIGTELALCQRYFQSWGGTTLYEYMGVGQASSTTNAYIQVPQLVSFRAAPSVSTVGTLSIGGAITVTSIAIDQAGLNSVGIAAGVASGLTSGNCVRLVALNSTSSRLQLSAEL
jgi:hypothetical protein